jgi:hypothetical protein
MAKQVSDIVSSWIICTENFWAHEALNELIDSDPEQAWLIIQEIAKHDFDDESKAMFAAGPLEEILAKNGPRIIDRIEAKAKTDPKFNDLLGGLWKNTMSDEVWARVEAARKRSW